MEQLLRLGRTYLSLSAMAVIAGVGAAVGVAAFQIDSRKPELSGIDVVVVVACSALAAMCVVELHARVLGARARFHVMTLQEYLPIKIPRPIAALPLERVMGHVSTQYDSIIAANQEPNFASAESKVYSETPLSQFNFGVALGPTSDRTTAELMEFLTNGDVSRGELGESPTIQTVRAVVEARLDWVQMIVAGRWQQIVRTEAVIAACASSVFIAGVRADRAYSAVVLVALGGIGGGVLSWTLRDIAAIIERRRL